MNHGLLYYVLALLVFAAGASAQPALIEVEPNDTPATALEFSGEAVLVGSMSAGDQDAFKWTVSDVDAQKFWSFEFQGIAGKLSFVDFLQLEYAENGVDVSAKRKLFSIGSRDGTKPQVIEDILLEPGEYLLGFVSVGGGGSFRPPAVGLNFSEEERQKQDSGVDAGQGYRFSIRSKGTPGIRTFQKAPADKSSAIEIRPEQMLVTYLQEQESWFSFDLSKEKQEQLYLLSGQVPAGRSLQMALLDGAGKELARTQSDEFGKYDMQDLALQPGRYSITAKFKDEGSMSALQLSKSGMRVDGSEAEPNNKYELANRLKIEEPIEGRLPDSGDEDYFQFAFNQEQSDRLWEIRLNIAEPGKAQICLLSDAGVRKKCVSGSGEISIGDLGLEAGSWGVVVERGASAKYSLSFHSEGQRSEASEIEPNDQIEDAITIPTNNRIKGRFIGDENDFYQILITEKPQLWRFQVMGEKLHELAYYDASGHQQQNYRVPNNQTRIRLENLYLLPGKHYVRVAGKDGGKYTLLAMPVGQPDPNAEFEPNDDTSRMQRLRFSQKRTGLLADKEDRDYYRFSLENWENISLQFTPAADGTVQANLYWEGHLFKAFNKPVPGERVELKGIFPPGDYHLLLTARDPSDADYSVEISRLPRFACDKDCEPNDNFDFASPFPADNFIEGRVQTWRDDDWYRLPVFDREVEMTISASSAVNFAISAENKKPIPLKRVATENTWQAMLPVGEPHFLKIMNSPENHYQMKFEFAGVQSGQVPSNHSALEMSLSFDHKQVAAFHQYGQQVDGKLVIKNSGNQFVEGRIEGTVSDHRWQLIPERKEFGVDAGETLELPVQVLVPEDAWPEPAVRISLKVIERSGSISEVFDELRADPEGVLRKPRQAWMLQKELLGGINVAWSKLGGQVVGDTSSAIGSGFDQLIDSMAVKNQGMRLRGGYEEKAFVTVKLAGIEPVPVAGIALNSLGMGYAADYLREFSLQLSIDGKEFNEVLTAEMLPIKREQSFVLHNQIPARFARLVFKSSYGGIVNPPISIGEFKVISAPGIEIFTGEGPNIADANLGGHVVWSSPAISAANWDDHMLNDNQYFETMRLNAGEQLEWVLGFHHNRVAKISELEWHPGVGPATADTPAKVNLYASVDSPLGPWKSIGQWDLTSSGKEPAKFVFQNVPWVRFLKFSVDAPDGRTLYSLPRYLKVFEKPPGQDYLSILGEWGFANRRSYYESLQPVALEAPFQEADNNSRQTAALLASGVAVRGRVLLGKHEHWYKLQPSADQNFIQIELHGEPTVRTVVHAETSSGDEILLKKLKQESDSGRHFFEAYVPAGQEIFLRIQEPPRNVVFAWDTSASVGAYLPVIYNALLSYAGDLVPGRDTANFLPFGSSMLMREWYGESYVLQLALNDYPRKESSSAAEKTLLQATEALAERPGTKAIVLVTDAATSRHAQMWDAFAGVQPRIFGIGVGSEGAFGRNPPQEQDLMQDWSQVNGGYYSLVLQESELEFAFQRAASMLRRPAEYVLSVHSETRQPPKPGRLQVLADEASKERLAAFAFILDASGSMLKRIRGKTRINIAKDVLIDLLNNHIPAKTPLALRVFGHREINSCRTDLEIPLVPLDAPRATRFIGKIQAKNLAKTPIADSLAQIPADLKGAKGTRSVILITDGEETCEGDPAKVIEDLKQQGFDVKLNIVGFAIDNSELESQFAGWAKLGGGQYFRADDQQGLQQALLDALQVPYRAFDSSGEVVGTGIVGQEPIELSAGVYKVIVDTAPPTIFKRVEIHPESSKELKIAH